MTPQRARYEQRALVETMRRRILALAREPASPERNLALRDAHRALVAAYEALARLERA